MENTTSNRDLFSGYADMNAPVLILNSKGTVVYKNAAAERSVRINRREKLSDYLMQDCIEEYREVLQRKKTMAALRLRSPGVYRGAFICAIPQLQEGSSARMYAVQCTSIHMFLSPDVRQTLLAAQTEVMISLSVLDSVCSMLLPTANEEQTQLVEMFQKQEKNVYGFFLLLCMYYAAQMGEHMEKVPHFADLSALISEVTEEYQARRDSRLPEVLFMPQKNDGENSDFCCRIYSEEFQKFYLTKLFYMLQYTVSDIVVSLQEEGEDLLVISVTFEASERYFSEKDTQSGKTDAHYMGLRMQLADDLARLNGWEQKETQTTRGVLTWQVRIPRRCGAGLLHAQRLARAAEETEQRRMAVQNDMGVMLSHFPMPQS